MHASREKCEKFPFLVILGRKGQFLTVFGQNGQNGENYQKRLDITLKSPKCKISVKMNSFRAKENFFAGTY